jgi:hypothetical protein
MMEKVLQSVCDLSDVRPLSRIDMLQYSDVYEINTRNKAGLETLDA